METTLQILNVGGLLLFTVHPSASRMLFALKYSQIPAAGLVNPSYLGMSRNGSQAALAVGDTHLSQAELQESMQLTTQACGLAGTIDAVIHQLLCGE